MPVAYRNFEYSYDGPKGKPVFVPSEEGREIGVELIRRVESQIEFEPIFYHYRPGGHVAAIHAHRENKFFAKIDLKSFFYSIARNRVGHALYDIGLKKPGHYAKWSTVKNPYKSPSYALPYGFVQSPIAATLVLRKSELGRVVLELAKSMTLSVYLDDIAISANGETVLEQAFQALILAAQKSGFTVSTTKASGPSLKAVLFNCELEYKKTAVTEARRAVFYSVPRSLESCEAFEKYCLKVQAGHVVSAD